MFVQKRQEGQQWALLEDLMEPKPVPGLVLTYYLDTTCTWIYYYPQVLGTAGGRNEKICANSREQSLAHGKHLMSASRPVISDEVAELFWMLF